MRSRGRRESRSLVARVIGVLVVLLSFQISCSQSQRPTASRLDESRWVVEKVKIGMEMPGDISVIHPSLVHAKNGDLLLYGNAYPGNRFKAKTYDVLMARSMDQGENWSEPKRIFTEPPLDGGKPTWAASGITLKSGRIILFGGFGSTEADYSKLRYERTGQRSPYGFPVTEVRGGFTDEGEVQPLLSDDDGLTWHAAEPIKKRQGGVILRSIGGITQMPNGELLSWFDGFTSEEAISKWQYSNGFIRSRDQGETWGEPTIVAPWDGLLHDFPNEMSIVVLPDGRWVALYRNQFFRDDYNSTGIFLYRSYSYDRGQTWSTGQQIFPNMGYTTATLLPDGALMVIGHGYQGILYAVSNDGGETWDYQNLLWGRDPRLGGDCGGFAIVSQQDGRALIAYYAMADRSARLSHTHGYGKMRLELAWLKKVKADGVEGRMR